MTAYHEVAVVGGGPAGASAAYHLACAGVSVALVDPGHIPTGGGVGPERRLEGLGARVAELLAAKGLDRALEAATPPVRRSVRWAGLSESANRESLVERQRFDALLRALAEEAGAVRYRTRLAGIDDADPIDGVSLRLSDGSELYARLMIDARGRQARSGARLMGPQTLSIAGVVRGATVADEPGAHVEAAPQGWLWAVTHPEIGHWVQISVDARDLEGAGEAALEARLRRFLIQPQFAERYASVALAGRLRARNCGLVLSACELRPPVIPVGDAAVGIDPLSGHGQFWALSSALAALPIARYLIDDPLDEAGLAGRFFADRVVGTFWRQARVGRDFYRLETALAHEPYWAARAAWPDAEPSHATVDVPSLQRRVVVEEGRLAERDVLLTPKDPDGVAFVGGIPIAELLDAVAAAPPETRPSLPGRSPQAARLAVGWLESRGLLGDGAVRLPHSITKSTTSTTTRETA